MRSPDGQPNQRHRLRRGQLLHAPVQQPGHKRRHGVRARQLTVRSARSFLSGDRGAAGNIEVLPLSVLVFVVGTLLITNAWAVIDARMAVSAAAREATRAYTEAPDASSAAGRADAAARSTIAGHGRDPSRMRLDMSTQALARCAPVTIRAGYEVPAIHLPWIGGYGHGFDVWSTHTELVDPYRSGLAGEAQC